MRVYLVNYAHRAHRPIGGVNGNCYTDLPAARANPHTRRNPERQSRTHFTSPDFAGGRPLHILGTPLALYTSDATKTAGVKN